MKKLLMLMLFVTIGVAERLQSQSPVASAPKTPATAPEKKAKKTASEKKVAGQKQDKSPAENLFGTGLQSNEPTTTEIYADEAFFEIGRASCRERVCGAVARYTRSTKG